jgi:SulP family sulfate permease
MSEWENFKGTLKGPKSDVAVMVTTFLLTVLVDLTVAIEIGMVLAAFLFLRKLIKSTDVSVLSDDEHEYKVPKDVAVFEISGPLFFGAVYKFKDAIRDVSKKPKVFIIRMGKVPIIDATGISTLKEVQRECAHKGIKLILSEVNNEDVLQELKSSRLMFAIGKSNITSSFENALERTKQVLDGPKRLSITAV